MPGAEGTGDGPVGGTEREARAGDAPLVETPPRNLPLPEERDLPQHYSPRV